MRTPLWIIAGVLCFFMLIAIDKIVERWQSEQREERRRAELLRKEPWRKLVNEPYRYDPNYYGDW